MAKHTSNRLLAGAGNLLLLAAAYLFIEFGAYAVYRAAFGEWHSAAAIAELCKTAAATDEQTAEDLIRGKQSVLHPYLGYVYNPEGWKVKHDGIPISGFGFIDDKLPVQRRSPETTTIGIFGGSVAWWFQRIGMDSMLEQLSELEAFNGTDVKIVRLALGGYKQPQQLLTLSYLDALGAEFDFIINLDGYNEVALPPFHNTPHGVHPYFPVNWKEQLTAVGSKATIRSLGRLTILEGRRTQLAGFLDGSVLRRSPAVSLLWRLYDKNIQTQLGVLRAEIASPYTSAESLPFAVSGPSFTKKDADYYDSLAALWMRSSLAMHRMCESRGCRYYHFLQPNQYVPGSKPMSPEEKEIALGGVAESIDGVIKGYPLLKSKGAQLAAAGVKFHDMTMVFRETKEHAYNDSCCHLSKLGNEILGTRIGKLIAEDLQSAP